ncbi:hypothetical protein ACWEOA_16740 [Streptomyces sp. NPDC004457]
MITVHFTVRTGQGDAGGFDMGDMAVTGDFGTADSAGHDPDQGMMIYLSIVQLKDSLGAFLRDNARMLSFTGADTSFGLAVRRTNDGLSVAGKNGLELLTESGWSVSSGWVTRLLVCEEA